MLPNFAGSFAKLLLKPIDLAVQVLYRVKGRKTIFLSHLFRLEYSEGRAKMRFCDIRANEPVTFKGLCYCIPNYINFNVFWRIQFWGYKKFRIRYFNRKFNSESILFKLFPFFNNEIDSSRIIVENLQRETRFRFRQRELNMLFYAVLKRTYWVLELVGFFRSELLIWIDYHEQSNNGGLKKELYQNNSQKGCQRWS